MTPSQPILGAEREALRWCASALQGAVFAKYLPETEQLLMEGQTKTICQILDLADAALSGPTEGSEPVKVWQQRCLDKGFQYVRAPDDHYVECTQEQAIDLLRDVLGVDVRIEPDTELRTGHLNPDYCKGFEDGKATSRKVVLNEVLHLEEVNCGEDVAYNAAIFDASEAVRRLKPMSPPAVSQDSKDADLAKLREDELAATPEKEHE